MNTLRLILLGLVCSVLAPGASFATDENPDNKLDKRLERLARQIDERRKDLRIPGMGFALVLDDQVVMSRGFGLRDVENQIPADENTLFAIGSTTKAFAACLIAMLEDEGKMSFDDPVNKHVPWFGLKNKDADTQVTVRDLLCHRTGITRMSILWYGNDASRDAILRRVVDAEEWAPFRTQFLYNNVMYLAAGRASARAADTDWDTLLDERIFTPLKMDRSTSIGEVALADSQISKGYTWNDEERDWTEVPFRNLDNCAPAGSIVSSVQEMTQWIRLQLNRGVVDGRRLVSDEQFDRMWEPQGLATGPSPYALGWFIRDWNGNRVVEHGGNIDGFAASVGMLPEKKLGYVMLTNVGQTPLQQRMVNIVSETMLGEWTDNEVAITIEGEPLSEEALEPYSGIYKQTEVDLEAKVTVRNGRLVVATPLVNSSLLWPEQNVWRASTDPTTTVRFEKNDDEFVHTLHLSVAGQDIRFPRVEGVEHELPLTVDELMDLRTEKRGGAPLDEVTSISMKGTVDVIHSGLRGEIQMIAQGPDRVRIDVDFGEFGKSQLIVSDGAGIAMGGRGPDRELEGATIEALNFLNPFIYGGDWRDYAEALEVLREDTQRNRAVYVVQFTTSGETEIELVVEKGSGRLIRSDGHGQLYPILTMPTPYRYDDYREVGPFHLPFQISASTLNTGRTLIQFEEAVLDVEVDESLFDF